MRQKKKGKRKFAFNILAWVSYASRPLSGDELRYSLAAKNAVFPITEAALLPATEFSSFCCGLVVSNVNRTVSFVHYFAKTYFQSHREELFGKFHLVAAFTCAGYLCGIPLERYVASGDAASDSFEDSDCEGDEYITNPKTALRDNPFASYAGEFLREHYRPIRSQPRDFTGLSSELAVPSERRSVPVTQREVTHSEVIDLMRPLVESDERRSFYCDILASRESYYAPHRSWDPQSHFSWSWRRNSAAYVVSPLHVAVFLGCSELVEQQLSKGPNVDELDSYDQSALVIAFKNGFNDVAGILLNQGAAVDLSVARGHVLVFYATQMNYDRAVRVIFSRAAGTEAAWTLSMLLVLALSPAIILLRLVGLLIGNSGLILLPLRFTERLKPQDHAEDDNEEKDPYFKQYCRLLLAAYGGDLGAWRNISLHRGKTTS